MQRKARRRSNAGSPCKPAQRRDAPVKYLSLWVTAKMSVCGVVGLTSGGTIGFALRLASISF
jgi:hypothetical protein